MKFLNNHSLSNTISGLLFSLALSALTSFTTTAQAAENFTLVTKLEHAQFMASLNSTPKRILLNKNVVPVVLVESPLLDSGEIQGPIDIIVRFETTDDATIEMESLSISYGFFMDITDRILEQAEFDSISFTVRNADVPKGKHSFTIRVKDSLGREAEKEFNVVVT